MKTQLLIAALATALTAVTAVAAPKPTHVVSQIMSSAKVDLVQDEATLPLHLGHLKDGRSVYFVITDTNDRVSAKKYGVGHTPALASFADLKSTRMATVDANGNFVFESGTVDFSPKRSLTTGDAPNYFPPKAFAPGSVGDANYSPFVKIAGTTTVFNAPIVAFNVDPTQISFCNGQVNYDLVHDRVTKICPQTMQVSLSLGHGFADGQQVVYLSFDSNNALPATMEAATYTPATQDQVGSQGAEILYAIANGATGVNNPDRQGFNSALSGEGPPLNILEGLTTDSSSYSPLWDVQVAVYSAAAIAMNERHVLTSGDAVRAASSANLISSPPGGPVKTLGLLVNCPVIGFVQ